MAGGARLRAGPGPGPVSVSVPVPVQPQLLPCRVGSDGPAPVSAFLRVRPGPGGELWASFRGRRMGGRELPLPHGYRGALLQETAPLPPPPPGREGDPQERWVTVAGTFEVITEWGADDVPSPAVGLALALQWGPLAQAIHAPVPLSDSDEEAEP